MKYINEIHPERNRLKKLLAVSAVALITGIALTVPAWAAVRSGKTVTVFPNRDMVSATGYAIGSPLTIEVFRNGVRIGTTTGPAVDTPEGPGLEVNHGPAGAAQPGDCWVGATPNIIGGDEVRVTGDGGTDTTTVPGINLTSGPIQEANGDIVLEGTAVLADGSPIPLARMTGELRQADPRFRAAPNVVQRVGTNGWRAIYRTPYDVVQDKDGIAVAQQTQAIMSGSHSMTYERTLREVSIAEFSEPAGPAPGCEAAPFGDYAITNASKKAVNIANSARDLVYSGVSQNASAVSITLNDRDATTPAIISTATTSAADGSQTWRATFSAADVATLRDGNLTARGSYTVNGTDIRGVNLSILKDTRAPGAPKATPRAGTYQGTQFVSLETRGANKIHYTQSGIRPTTNSRVFTRQIRVSSTQTIKAIAVDKAGNTSRAVGFRYVIR